MNAVDLKVKTQNYKIKSNSTLNELDKKVQTKC